MRYIIIPLGIILYALWTFLSIDDIKFSKKHDDMYEVVTYLWISFTITVSLGGLAFLSYLYW